MYEGDVNLTELNHKPSQDEATSSEIKSNSDYDYLLKLIIIGPSGSGKTSLLHRFLHNEFHQFSSQTVGVEFSSKIVSVSAHTTSKRLKLQLWDTAGQERFRSVCRSYFRGAAGALLVYDSSDLSSFDSLNDWISDVRALASPNIVVTLAGSKSDLVCCELTRSKAKSWAKENNIQYFYEASAVSGENVDAAILSIAQEVLAKIEMGEIDPGAFDSGVHYGDRITSSRLGSANRNRSSSLTWIQKVSDTYGIDWRKKGDSNCNC